MNSRDYGGMSFMEALQLIFIAFKLSNIIDWSWWLVLWPFWAFIFLVILTVLFAKD